MAGYVIHIIIAEEYLRKHNVKDRDEFIKGTIYPDSVKIKGETHYSEYYSCDANLYKFLLDKKLDNSYNLGYFLHLVVDCIFYNKYFILPDLHNISDIVHNDYDILNKFLLEKYSYINFPKEVEKYIGFKEGKPEVLDENKIEECINEASNYDLEVLAKEILDKKDYKKVLGVI